MHDIRLIRDDPAAFDAALAKRGVAPQAADLLALDAQRRSLITEAQAAQARRNEASKAIGAAKAAKDDATASALMAEVGALKDRLPAIEAEEKSLGDDLGARLAALPNLPLADVPEGADETDNTLEKTVGTPPTFAFEPREHDAIGPALGLDFETGVALAGARFTLLRGAAAQLHRASRAVHAHHAFARDHGYEQVVPPLLVRDEVMFGTGQLPKFAEDSFQTTGRPLADPDGRSIAHQHRSRTNPERGRPAAALRRAHRVLPLGSRCGGARHARFHPSAPVREGRDGLDHRARSVRSGARADDCLCRGYPWPSSAYPSGG